MTVKDPSTLTLEVERKYDATEVNWKEFTAKCRALNPVKELKVTGPDTYYANTNSTLRWRLSGDLNEITFKKRLSNRSSLVRMEVDWKLNNNSVRETIIGIRALGLKKLFRITKTCVIFYYPDVSVVIYRVKCKGRKNKTFIEIESHKGQSLEASKAHIKKWEDKLELNPETRLNKTLYELYNTEEKLKCIKR
jgi:predicted adenylyl cyclase CyaB